VKEIEVLHASFGAYVAVTAIAVVVIIGLVVTNPGVARHLPRLGKCAAFAAFAALALDIYADTRRHAQLVAEAARPVNGHHVTAGYLLADGFAGTFLIVTVVTFAIATVVARRRAPAFGRVPARPRAGAGTWLP
jgi:hypothetical protein